MPETPPASPDAPQPTRHGAPPPAVEADLHFEFDADYEALAKAQEEAAPVGPLCLPDDVAAAWSAQAPSKPAEGELEPHAPPAEPPAVTGDGGATTAASLQATQQEPRFTEMDVQPAPSASPVAGAATTLSVAAARWAPQNVRDAPTPVASLAGHGRTAPRLDFSAPAVLSFDGYEETFEVNITNLSTAGLCCRGPKGLSVGDRVRLKFCLRATEPARTFLSEVRWVQCGLADDATYGLGFVALPLATQAALEATMRELLSEQALQQRNAPLQCPSEAPFADPDYRAFVSAGDALPAGVAQPPAPPAAASVPSPRRAVLLPVLTGMAAGSLLTALLGLAGLQGAWRWRAPADASFAAIKSANPTLGDLAQLHADTAMRAAERRSAQAQAQAQQRIQAAARDGAAPTPAPKVVDGPSTGAAPAASSVLPAPPLAVDGAPTPSSAPVRGSVAPSTAPLATGPVATPVAGRPAPATAPIAAALSAAPSARGNSVPASAGASTAAGRHTAGLLPSPPTARTLPAGLRLQERSGQLEMVVELDGPAATKEAFWLSEPTRLVIDVARRRTRLQGRVVELGHPLVQRLRVGDHPHKTRLVLETRGSRAPRVHSRFVGNALHLTLQR